MTRIALKYPVTAYNKHQDERERCADVKQEMPVFRIWGYFHMLGGPASAGLSPSILPLFSQLSQGKTARTVLKLHRLCRCSLQCHSRLTQVSSQCGLRYRERKQSHRIGSGWIDPPQHAVLGCFCVLRSRRSVYACTITARRCLNESLQGSSLEQRYQRSLILQSLDRAI